MRNNNWLTNDWRQRRLSDDLTIASKLRALRLCVSAICAWLLLVLVMLLSACTTLPPAPCEPQSLPTAPALTEPLPSVSYSISVERRIRGWAKSLTDTPATSKP